jgi:hypothetical protein
VSYMHVRDEHGRKGTCGGSGADRVDVDKGVPSDEVVACAVLQRPARCEQK